MSRNLKYHGSDNGNCRVYYKHGRQVLAFQREETWGRVSWWLMACSKDGEPSHATDFMQIGNVELPKGDDRIDYQLKVLMGSPDWHLVNTDEYITTEGA